MSRNTEIIYESADGDLKVRHDTVDQSWPIAFGSTDGGWVGRNEAIEACHAVLTALGEDIPSSAVRASQVSFNEGLIRLAAVHGKTVTFRYAKSQSAPIETRSFVPRFVAQKDGHVTFTGYDPDRGAIRAFRSDRMVGEVTVS